MKHKTKHAETAKRSYKLTNDILEDHGDWLLVDISTSKHPKCTMAVDTDVWDQREGGRVFAGKTTTAKYICGQHMISNKTRLFHHQVIQKTDVLEVDHKIHGSMAYVDNRRSNLRTVTRSQNGMNKGNQRNNKSGIIGVSWNKLDGKWFSRIKLDGKEKFLGSFDDIEEAAAARKAAEEKYFGEYAFKSEDSK